MSAVEARLGALVRAARADEPTVADRARVRAALAAQLAALPPGSSPGAPSSSAIGETAAGHAGGDPQTPVAGAATAPAGVAAKLLAVGALLGAVGVGLGIWSGVLGGRASVPTAVLARGGAEAQARAIESRLVVEPAVEGARVAMEAAPEPLPVAVGYLPARIAGVAPSHAVIQPRRDHAERDDQAPGGAAARAPGEGSLVAETELLRRAQTSLGTGDAAGALARLDELGRRFPAGLLREERLAARIAALCAAGRDVEAHREAERFLAEAPLSIHAARVRRACVVTPRSR